jgi:hypothetical protein
MCHQSETIQTELLQDPRQIKNLKRRLERTHARIATLKQREEELHDLYLASIRGPIRNEAGQILCIRKHLVNYSARDEQGRTWREWRYLTVGERLNCLEIDKFCRLNEHAWVTFPHDYDAANRCGLLEIFRCDETGEIEFYDQFSDEKITA